MASGQDRWDVAGACLAAAAFAVLCVLVLRAARYLPEQTVTLICREFGLGSSTIVRATMSCGRR